MRNRVVVLILLLIALFVPVRASAQTRVLVGVEGAQAFDNSSVGAAISLEVPFAKRFEIDLQDTFSPIESHVSLGGGRANITSATGRVWFSQHWGLVGGVEDSMYDVTKVTKDADYGFGGFAYRASVGGLPARFSFEYVRQFNNGISPSGLESSHLQGADIGYTMRFGCLGAICIRNSEDIVAGRVLTQGNQNCDGSLPIVAPNVYCGPRGSAFGGGVTASISIEFPRHKGHEYDPF